MSVVAYIGMGSNLGKSSDVLQDAWARLHALDNVEGVALSSPYESSPVGMESENLFINAVAKIAVNLEPMDLLAELFAIEKDLGRRRIPGQKGYQDRSLDLDLLYYGEQCINLPRLQVPHPRCDQRLFVLEPLVEIAPEYIDPKQNICVSDLLKSLQQQLNNEEVAPQEIFKRGGNFEEVYAMALLRLFIVATLIYFLIYLVRQVIKKRNTNEEQSEDSLPHDVHDVLVEDPVCKKLLPKKQALRCKYGQDIVYFCSEKCCEVFEKTQEGKE